jgi:V/A-type H+-transporting ATPase subunit K
MIMTALPGSQAVYGLLISFLIINAINGMETVSTAVGTQFLWVGMIMGLAGLFSGWFQGRVAAGGIGAIARNESLLGNAIILAALVETSAIFGLLISVLFLPK